MGGCCSAAQSDGVKLVGYEASAKGDASGEGPKRHILRVKAQVLYLSYDAPDGAGGVLAPPSSGGQWLPVMKEAVFVALRCVKESETRYVYQVSASSVDGTQFCSYLEVPQVRLRKVSDTFVFWKDEAQGKVLGLSFASERDTLRFLAGCTPVSADIRSGFTMTTTHTSHSLPPAPPPLSHQDPNEHMATPPSPAPPTSGANHLPYITPVPNHSPQDLVPTVISDRLDESEGPPFSPLSPLFPEEMNWTMSVLYGDHTRDDVTDYDSAEAAVVDEEGSIHESVVSSDCDPVTYIDDMSSQSDGEEREEEEYVIHPAQPGGPPDVSFKWDSSDAVENPALRFSFTLHDIPEAEEERESESESEWSRRRAPPPHLTLPSTMSETSVVSSEQSFGTRPPSLPLSPAPGDLMSPTLDVSDASSPRYTALFDKFDTIESPIHEFDAILRELSKSISLDRIVSGEYPSPPTSRTSTNISAKDNDFQSTLHHLRGVGVENHDDAYVDEEGEELPSPRQRKISNESTSSQMKVSRSLDYLSEVVTFMERFSLDVDEQEVDQQEDDEQEVIGEGEVVDEVVVAFSVTVRLPSDQEVVLTVTSDTAVRDVVWESCEPNHYVPEEHFAVLFSEDHRGRSAISVPSEADFLCNLEFSRIEIWEKDIRTVHLAQPYSSRERFGLTLDPLYAEEDEEMLLAAVVKGVAPGSPAHQEGIVATDEIVFFQDQAVFDLSWGQVLTFLNSPSISLTLRSCRMALIQSRGKRSSIYRRRPRSCSEDFMIGMSVDVVEAFLDHREGGDTTSFEDSFESLEEGVPFLSGTTISLQRQKMVDKVEKTVKDLLQSERKALQHLKSVVDIYYKPLQRKSVSNEEVSALFGGLSEAIFFKEQFLQDLQTVVSTVLDSSAASHNPLQRTKLLAHRVSTVFLRHSDRFRQCSSFCTSHCRLQHVIAVEDTTTAALRQFLQSLAPSNQLDLSLETMLAKPIQRVLQYPLYLHVVVKQMGVDSQERRHLEDAINKMDGVVNYINDMQRISDSYTHVLDGMLREAGQWKLNSCVSMQQLKYHGVVTWLNPPEEMAKGWRKGQGPDMQCFIFTAMIMLFVVEKKRRRTSRASLVGAVPVVMLEDLRYKTILLCSNCVARDLPDSDGVTNMCQFFSAAMGSMRACSFLIRSRTWKQKSDILQQFH